MTDRERIYDKQIAPLLLKAGKIAEAHGMPIVAQVEYAPGEFGLTAHVPDGTSYAMRFLHRATLAYRNLDSFLFWVIRHAREHGHSSAVLAILLRALDDAAPAPATEPTTHPSGVTSMADSKGPGEEEPAP